MDTDTSTPKRFGELPGPLRRRQAQVAARSEREEVCERMRSIINLERKRDGLTGYSPIAFNVRLKPYLGPGNARQRLQRLYKFEGDCREVVHSGFGNKEDGLVFGTKAYALFFEWTLKQHKPPKQLTI